MSGLPEIDDFVATYGGAKANYAPPEDPLTDEDAAVRNQYVANVAMMTATVTRAWARFTGATTTGGLILVAHNALWGTGGGVAPTLARTSAGIYTVTWPTTVTDPLTNTHTLNIRGAWMNIRDTGTGWDYYVNPTSANVVTVYTMNSAGAATDATGKDIDVFWL